MEQWKIVTLMKGILLNSTTCVAACALVKGMITTVERTNQVIHSKMNMSVSAQLNYFRCYAFENGNNENVINRNLSGEDIQCDPGTKSLLIWAG